MQTAKYLFLFRARICLCKCRERFDGSVIFATVAIKMQLKMILIKQQTMISFWKYYKLGVFGLISGRGTTNLGFFLAKPHWPTTGHKW